MAVFDHYSIATSAMRAFKLGMNIAGYNVANANTEGFSRRRVDLNTMSVVAVPGGWSGMGVEVNSLTRVRDPFLDFAVRREVGRLGQDDARSDILSALEPAIGEVDSAALRTSISGFFDSLENLSIQPASMAIREDVSASAQSLAGTIRSLNGYITENQRHADTKAEDAVDRINAIAAALAQNNLELTGLEAGGAEASDMRDQRDLLLDELSSLVPVNIVQTENGQVNIALEGTGNTLVTGTTTHELTKGTDANGFMRIVITQAGVDYDLTSSLRSGALGGYLGVRDDELEGYGDQLDLLATALIDKVNALHANGYDLNGDPAISFFEPDPPGADAANAIRFNGLIAADPALIAAAGAAGEPGDNAIVLDLLDLRTATVGSLDDRSLVGFSADLIATVGRDLATAEAAREASLVIVDSLEVKRQSVSGVSLDEEAAELARWQQSFEAAAKFMQVLNRITETALSLVP